MYERLRFFGTFFLACRPGQAGFEFFLLPNIIHIRTAAAIYLERTPSGTVSHSAHLRAGVAAGMITQAAGRIKSTPVYEWKHPFFTPLDRQKPKKSI
jgi:hypothetical protein